MLRKIFLFILIIVAIWFIKEWFTPDTVRIRKIIRESQQFANKKDILRLTKHFAPEFIDDSGLGKDDITAIAYRIFQQFEKIEVKYKGLSLEVQNQKATAKLDIYFYIYKDNLPTGQAGLPDGSQELLGELFAPARGSNRFKVEVAKMEGKWKFVKSSRVEE